MTRDGIRSNNDDYTFVSLIYSKSRALARPFCQEKNCINPDFAYLRMFGLMHDFGNKLHKPGCYLSPKEIVGDNGYSDGTRHIPEVF